MPVMRQLRIGSETYDTVGEASVTQVQTSGTKIATVTIDGTATDLYAPEGGGGGPEPSSTTPAMDGTSAVGTSTDYARADHVHPTDTSRAAASHTHAIADVTGLQTALDGKQGTLVSGTSIKTVNGTSLLGSGDIATPTYTLPPATTSTLGGVKVDGTTITATDGVISAVGGGGGGGYDLVINVTLNDGGTAVVSHDADFLECMSFARAFASGQDVRAVAYCRYASYDDEDDIYAAGADALPLVHAGTQSYGGGQYETDGGWSLTFIAVASITQRTVSGNKVSYVKARQLVVRASNDDPELGVSVDYSVL